MKNRKILILTTCWMLSLFLATSASYLKGHYDGSMQSELRSLSYEVPVLEDIEAAKSNDAMLKLIGLMQHRYAWITSGVSIMQSFNYWAGIDQAKVKAETLPRVHQVIDRPHDKVTD